MPKRRTSPRGERLADLPPSLADDPETAEILRPPPRPERGPDFRVLRALRSPLNGDGTLVHLWKCALCGWQAEVEQLPDADPNTWWLAILDAHPPSECAG